MFSKEQARHLRGRIEFSEHTFGGIQTKYEWVMIYDMRCVFLSILASSLPSMWLADLLQSARPLTLIPPKTRKPFPQLEENIHHLFMLEESLFNLFEKENHLPNLHFWGSMKNFPGCNPSNRFELRCGLMWKLKNSPDSSFLPQAVRVSPWNHEAKQHRGHRCLRWQPWEQKGEKNCLELEGWKSGFNVWLKIS